MQRSFLLLMLGVPIAFGSKQLQLSGVDLDLDAFENLARREKKQRVRTDVLAESRGLRWMIKQFGLAIAGFGPDMPWTAKLPEAPPPPPRDDTLLIVMAAAVACMLAIPLAAAVTCFISPHQKSVPPAPSAPLTLSPSPPRSYGGKDPLISVAFQLLNTTGDGRLTLPQLTEGSKTMWDVAAPALGELLRMQGDIASRPTDDDGLVDLRERTVARAFYQMDEDSDGVVHEADFQKFVRGIRFTHDPVLTVFFNFIDVSGSGTVNQKEFSAAVATVHTVAKDATLLALGVDPAIAAKTTPDAEASAADETGSTDQVRDESREALRAAVQSAFEQIDRNRDGAVDLDEFQRHFQALALKI